MTTSTVPAPAEQAKAGLPEAVSRRNIDEAQWRTLMNSLFPGAKSESVLMVVDYCRARKLDPLKKPCHIVPMKVKDAKTGDYEWRDVVMPGIYEYRTTAMRTGNYLGHSKPEYGPMAECLGVTAPEWCEMTVFRRASNGERIEFPVRVYFRECCATKFDKETKVSTANERWSKAPIQMLTKCTEAAGLREAFPDEFGGETTAEEMEGRDQVIDVQPVTVKKVERASDQKPAEPVTPEPEPAKAEDRPKNIGLIVDIQQRGDAAIAILDTGYYAGTKNADMQQSLARLRDAKQRVELIAKPARDPKFAPMLEEINIIQDGVA